MNKTAGSLQRTMVLSFLAGFFLLGPTDLFHTATGVQKYVFRYDYLTIGTFNWPWYIPLQLGIIMAGVGGVWTFILNKYIHPSMKISPVDDIQPLGKFLVPFVFIMIVSGFILGRAALNYEYHLSLYLVCYAASLVIISFSFSKYYIIAFILISIGGPMTEWFLLSPSVGYYEFIQKDLFGRVPGWQPFVYGWGGIFFHYISSGAGKDINC